MTCLLYTSDDVVAVGTNGATSAAITSNGDLYMWGVDIYGLSLIHISFLHPGRQANVVYDGTVIGYLGEVHPTVAANYAIKERVYVAVLDMPEIVSRASFDPKYEGIAKDVYKRQALKHTL